MSDGIDLPYLTVRPIIYINLFWQQWENNYDRLNNNVKIQLKLIK